MNIFSHPIQLQSAAGQSRRLGHRGAVAFLLLLIILGIVRSIVIYKVIGYEIAGYSFGMAATAIQQDASLAALLLACTGYTYLVRQYWLQLPLLLFSTVLLLAYAADIFVTQTLVQRLYLLDIIKFGKELNGILLFLGAFIATSKGKFVLIFAIIASVVLILALWPRPYRPRLAIGCFIIAAALAVFGQWRPVTMQYVHNEMLKNLIAVNLDLGVDRRYSQAYAERIASKYIPPKSICSPGQSLHPNIIVLVVESLSMHHSLLFSGLSDWTPQLDAIARENAWFPDFIANGFTTDGGLIATITGRAPIPAVNRYQSLDAFSGFTDPQGAVPDLLHSAGYTAHFFTTGDLGFLDKTSWLKALHFDSWEGAEHPFYNGWKRHLFNAAEDKALYLRFMQWLDERSQQQPFVSYLLTVSTHPPSTDPRSDKFSEEGAFRYADKEIGTFYTELKKRGFFHNGILLIIGDHRSMTPLLSGEQKHFGGSAMARVPLIMATDLPLVHGRVAGMFQQTDIVSSLADLALPQACRTPMQGIFLRAAPVPAGYVLHARSDKRDTIDVFFENQQAEIVLSGDNSYWTGPKPTEWQTIFDGIMLDRIQRGILKENFLDLIIKFRIPQK
jgi:phosphoglycerol transferase MdoB-like AlkP superfamily enzyme